MVSESGSGDFMKKRSEEKLANSEEWFRWPVLNRSPAPKGKIKNNL